MIGRPSQGVGIKCTYAHPSFFFIQLISNVLVILVFSTHTLFDSNIYLLSARLGRNLSLRIIEYVLLFIKTLVRFVRLCSPYFDYYLDGMVYGLILHKS